MTATLNGQRVTSVRIEHPYRGAWFADVRVDTGTIGTVGTSGPATLTVGDTVVMVGKIDPRSSGTFGPTASVRVVGGLGWDKTVQALHFHNDNGVSSTMVYAATASPIGEVIVDAAPVVLGLDYVRSAGAASRVFGDRIWWVDVSGVTHTGERLPATLDKLAVLTGWDPVSQRAELACESLVIPGTILTDSRIGASVIVRDVVQTFDDHGSHITATCCLAPVSRLAAALKSAVREFSGAQYLKVYKYRYALTQDGGMALQAVHRNAGLPDLIPVTGWTGVSGMTAGLALSTEVLVSFIEGDPSQPIVVGYSAIPTPISVKIDASATVDIGASAPIVTIAGGAHFLVPAEFAIALQSALYTFANAASAAPGAAGISVAAGVLATTIGGGGFPSPSTTKTRAT